MGKYSKYGNAEENTCKQLLLNLNLIQCILIDNYYVLDFSRNINEPYLTKSSNTRLKSFIPPPQEIIIVHVIHCIYIIVINPLCRVSIYIL